MKKTITSFEHIPNEIPSNHNQIKQFRHEFIRKWTDDARNIYAQNHIIHSSNTYSDRITHRLRRKSTRHIVSSSSSSSSSSLNELYHNKTKEISSNSTCHSSIIENQSNIKEKILSSNNSAVVYVKPKKSNDNIECKIS